MSRRWLSIVVLATVALAGCSVGPGVSAGASSSHDTDIRLNGTVVAGPTCPVVTEPPQSRCASRPVAGAVVLVLDAAGKQVARTTSDANGLFAIDLRPGHYRLVPQPVDKLMGTAPEQEVTLADARQSVTITYDTGIR